VGTLDEPVCAARNPHQIPWLRCECLRASHCQY
jgi:hypothetical protein